MPEYRIYTPSAEGYRIFAENLKKTEIEGLKKEEEFLKDFENNPKNTDMETVRNRVKKLNQFYRTRISNDELREIENIILRPGFDAKLDNDGYGLVEELRRVPSKRTESGFRDHLSFASKYCYHCRPNRYPIYDSINVHVLSVYLGYEGKRDYSKYVECFKKFCSFLGFCKLKGNEGYYIDKYIQAIGTHSELLFRGTGEK